jgi:hypothetical protein
MNTYDINDATAWGLFLFLSGERIDEYERKKNGAQEKDQVD